jgi:HEAT repeat protein
MPHPLLDGSPTARAAALSRLANDPALIDAADLEALCACLADTHKLVQRRAAEVAAALARRGVAAIEARLRAALTAPELRLRWGAAYALFLIGPPPRAALPTLLEVMGLADGDLRWAAVDLLKQLAAAERPLVVGQLLAAAQTPGPQRKMALYCLRDLAVGEAFDAALSALGDARVDVRLAALALVATVHPDATTAADRIAALIDDADPRVQRAAIGTLGGLGVDSEAVRVALARAEASADASLQRAAAQSRRQLR